jgi:hypothetical protein
VHNIVVAFLQALSPGSAAATSSAHLTSVTTSIARCMTDAASFEKGVKSWPGLLSLCAAATAQFPPPHTILSTDDMEGQPMPSGLISPVFIAPPEASGNELLSEAGRLVLASLLKQSQQREWKMLFNSYIHGKSYATLYGKISNRGPTVITVRAPLLSVSLCTVAESSSCIFTCFILHRSN